MNYKHAYHAGNFADVLKHITLIALINAFKKKPTPFCYLDTHAGPGCYDLAANAAQKTKEYLGGISKVLKAKAPPDLVQSYIDTVIQINQQFCLPTTTAEPLRFYPGSPLLAKAHLRAQDKMLLCELHPEEYKILRSNFSQDKQAAVHEVDGLLALKAFLPPKEKRGLILIDSPFEQVNEYTTLVKAIAPACTRFANGVYAIWYPIKDKMVIKRFHYALKQAIAQDVLIVELTLYPEVKQALIGTGLAIINPPWQLKENLANSIKWLANTLKINDPGQVTLQFLK